MNAPIVVGVDFSPASRRAVEEAARRAREQGAPLVLVHATKTPNVLWAGSEDRLDPVQRILAEAKMDDVVELSNEWARPLREEGLEVDTVSEEADPAQLVRRVAAERGADVVVVGHHGWGAIKRMFLGSVAKSLLDDCPVPVVVVPETQE